VHGLCSIGRFDDDGAGRPGAGNVTPPSTISIVGEVGTRGDGRYI
jgi:hypothetical protein